jgi:hypothetical protein
MYRQCIVWIRRRLNKKKMRILKMKKNNWRRCLRISAAIVPLSLASVVASAGIIGVGFSTTGAATPAGSCGHSCSALQLTGTSSLSGLDSYFGSSGTPDFAFSALLDVTSGLLGSSAAGAPPNGGWQLQDGSGDSLYGSLTGWMSGSSSNPAGSMLLSFGVTGGTGLFGGTSGSGAGLGSISWNGSFGDAGLLLIGSPTGTGPSTASVPEPGTLALFAAALAAFGWTASRRRLTLKARRSSAV